MKYAVLQLALKPHGLLRLKIEVKGSRIAPTKLSTRTNMDAIVPSGDGQTIATYYWDLLALPRNEQDPTHNAVYSIPMASFQRGPNRQFRGEPIACMTGSFASAAVLATAVCQTFWQGCLTMKAPLAPKARAACADGRVAGLLR